MSSVIMRAIIFLFFSAIFFPAMAQAEAQIRQDWYWDLSGKAFAYAATENKDQRLLGQYCYYDSGACLYVITLGVSCRKGSEFNAILNSNVGSARVELVCGHPLEEDERRERDKQENENAFYIRPFKKIDGIIKEGHTIGFAVPMKSGDFRVEHFSLAGSAHTIERMRLGAKVKLGNQGKKAYQADDFL